MMVSFVLSFFPRDVLDEILNLIESVSEDFPSYSFRMVPSFSLRLDLPSCNLRGKLSSLSQNIYVITNLFITNNYIFGIRKIFFNQLFILKIYTKLL